MHLVIPIIIGVVLLVALGVGLYFILKKKKTSTEKKKEEKEQENRAIKQVKNLRKTLKNASCNQDDFNECLNNCSDVTRLYECIMDCAEKSCGVDLRTEIESIITSIIGNCDANLIVACLFEKIGGNEDATDFDYIEAILNCVETVCKIKTIQVPILSLMNDFIEYAKKMGCTSTESIVKIESCIMQALTSNYAGIDDLDYLHQVFWNCIDIVCPGEVKEKLVDTLTTYLVSNRGISADDAAQAAPCIITALGEDKVRSAMIDTTVEFIDQIFDCRPKPHPAPVEYDEDTISKFTQFLSNNGCHGDLRGISICMIDVMGQDFIKQFNEKGSISGYPDYEKQAFISNMDLCLLRSGMKCILKNT